MALAAAATLPAAPWGEKVRILATTQPHLQSMRRFNATVRAQAFNLWELLGGRGLGEEKVYSLSCEQRPLFDDASVSKEPVEEEPQEGVPASAKVTGDFDKELGGLTGGFPGGETGVIKFLEDFPPPAKQTVLSEENRRIEKEIPS